MFTFAWSCSNWSNAIQGRIEAQATQGAAYGPAPQRVYFFKYIFNKVSIKSHARLFLSF